MIDKGSFFDGQDRYLYEPFEQAMFHWDHKAETVTMRFVDDDGIVPVGYDHRLFNEAIRAGREITRLEFETGRPNEL